MQPWMMGKDFNTRVLTQIIVNKLIKEFYLTDECYIYLSNAIHTSLLMPELRKMLNEC